MLCESMFDNGIAGEERNPQIKPLIAPFLSLRNLPAVQNCAQDFDLCSTLVVYEYE